ncbi:MAG: aromatic ring-hydroxylating oxygenase subunit alpha [Ilumatobacteraceae bacterium]
MTSLEHTLTGRDYLDPAVYEVDRDLVLHRSWFVAGRGERLAPGNRDVVDVAGESVLLTRDRDGVLHAFANVCRHRGAQLCTGHSASTQGSLMCPYHQWTYALDGRLLATPRLEPGEVDTAQFPLLRHHVREWEGFVFLCVADEAPDFDHWLATDAAALSDLTRFGFGRLRIGAHASNVTAANWKIVVENYLECLHCAHVHPEFAELVPHFGTGWTWDASRGDGGVTLARGTTLSAVGVDVDVPRIEGLRAEDHDGYFGGVVFPNAFVDVTASCAVVSVLYPEGPHSTRMEMDFLFSPAALADPSFDPRPIVEFSELVAAQDSDVCELVHKGVSSRRFDHGVLTSKDAGVAAFVRRYRSAIAG